jgi:cytoskeletal protein RodZ
VGIGEALTAARSQAGLTVAQVSQRTRIRQTIIRAIENDDYSTCGGDFYARGHIRSIAKVVGADSEPLIQEYDADHRARGALSAVSLEELATTNRTSGPRRPTWLDDLATKSRRTPPWRPNWALVLAAALVVAFGVLGYSLLSGSSPAASAPPASGHHGPAHHHAANRGTHPAAQTSHGRPSPVPTPPRSSSPAVAPAVALAPVSATAFGVNGAGQGDDPQEASLAIDGNRGTAWQTDWYTTASFGNLYSGTGLLLDMGRPVTITAAQVTLGSAPGAALQLRVGDVPSQAALPPVARALDASGVVHLQPATPAPGRYVLIWFTKLPPDPAGTFQASVYDIRLSGHG